MLTEAAKCVLTKDVRLLRIKITLYYCDGGTRLLADLQLGNSNVKGYTLARCADSRDEELAAFINGLTNNEGAAFHSLKPRPTLEKLDLSDLEEEIPENCDVMLMTIVDMLQVNTAIQEIEWGRIIWEGEKLRIRDELICPLLEANATRARTRALADAWYEVPADSDTTEADANP